jgi:hypothetical protein
LPKHENVTELYFDNVIQLPKIYKPGMQQTIHFSVHNLESSQITYKYIITETNELGTQSHILATGSFVTLQDQYTKTANAVVLTDMGARAKISVNLEPANESISYWVSSK